MRVEMTVVQLAESLVVSSAVLWALQTVVNLVAYSAVQWDHLMAEHLAGWWAASRVAHSAVRSAGSLAERSAGSKAESLADRLAAVSVVC